MATTDMPRKNGTRKLSDVDERNPNAAPRFITKVRFRNPSRRGIDCPTDILVMTRNLVIWSRRIMREEMIRRRAIYNTLILPDSMFMQTGFPAVE
jgi:hypothetical protein